MMEVVAYGDQSELKAESSSAVFGLDLVAFLAFAAASLVLPQYRQESHWSMGLPVPENHEWISWK